jgi:hypothetical protein
MQVLASLLVSVLLVGLKLNSVKEIVQVIERCKELAVNLALLQRTLEDEDTSAWTVDVTLDTKQRQHRITAMESECELAYSSMENGVIEKGLAMFAAFEASSAGVQQLEHSATIDRSETKRDEATGLLLGRGEALIRGATQDIVAYLLNQDGLHASSRVDRSVTHRYDVLQHLNDHHTILFTRMSAASLGLRLSHRTFLVSVVAQRVADNPVTYMLVCVPIAHHDKISPIDEAGAVRAENCRAFRLTAVAPGVTKLDYVCSLDLKGSIPQAITNKLAIPGQMSGAPPISPPNLPPTGVRTPSLTSALRASLAHDTSFRGDCAPIDEQCAPHLLGPQAPG